jgi:alanine racemase
MARLVLTVNLCTVAENIRQIARATERQVIAVLKADAYGMGAASLARSLETMREVFGFAVSCPLEGVVLRKAKILKPILVLTGVLPGELNLIERWRLTPVVSDPAHLLALKNSPLPYHVKYDTGMGRLGFLAPQNHDPRILGAMSQLSSAGTDPAYTKEQIKRFGGFLGTHGPLPFVHLQNSAGIAFKVPWANLVRVGLAMFGEQPAEAFPVQLSYALELKARVVSVKTLAKGSSVSYNRSCVLSEDAQIAVVNIGYADGLTRALSNKGSLLVHGKPARVLGDITMDMTLIDTTGMDVRVGDWVVVVNAFQTFGAMARLAGTIPYELMCNLSSRARRVYRR